jgi:putative transposase
MNSENQPDLQSFQMPKVTLTNHKSHLPPKDWPHAPVHRLTDNGIYCVTVGTLHKKCFFESAIQRDLLERHLLKLAGEYRWQLEAWAVFANHYHFVARGQPDSDPLGKFIQRLHGVTSHDLNALDGLSHRRIWFNFWDTKLTHQHSYLARLNYVHQNPVKHGLVPVASQYRWCSAAWFERMASPAQVNTIYRFKIDRVNMNDDF